MKVAVSAFDAVGVRFASVDIAKVENEFMVMEINSGVMMEKVVSFISDGLNIAKNIYKDAIKKMFMVK